MPKSSRKTNSNKFKFKIEWPLTKVSHISIQVAPLLTVNGNRVLIKKRIKEITGKQLIMKDVHNLAARLKSAKNSTVEGVCRVIDDQFPHYKYRLAVVGTEVRGIMLQSKQMRQDFAKYPELLFADSTYKLNESLCLHRHQRDWGDTLLHVGYV